MFFQLNTDKTFNKKRPAQKRAFFYKVFNNLKNYVGFKDFLGNLIHTD